MRLERLEMSTNPPEFRGIEVIGAEAIDNNKHVNHAFYLTLFERQRANWMEKCGASVAEVVKRFAVAPMVKQALVDYKTQVFEGDAVTIFTAAENAKTHLIFAQRMLKDDREASTMKCVVVMVDADGRPRKIPEELGIMIDDVNAPIT